MKRICLMGLLLILTGCIDDKPQAVTPPPNPMCFEIHATSDVMPLMLNKCTGQTWLLSKTVLFDETGKATNTFTYRWGPLMANPEEPNLSSPYFKAPK